MITSDEGSTLAAKHKILIVDDHPVVRQGLARLIGQESNFEVFEGPDNVEEAFEQVKTLRPNLVLVDISLKDSLGLDLISQIRAYDSRIKTLVWSMFEESVYASRALRAGASGYINKREPIQTIIDAIRRVLLDDTVYLSPTMTDRVLQCFVGEKEVAEDPIVNLSKREVEVFRLLGQGKTTQAIASNLGIRPKTVESHREKIKTKLGLQNAVELYCRASQWMLENG